MNTFLFFVCLFLPLTIGSVVQLAEYLPSTHQAHVQSPALHKLGVVTYYFNSSTCEVEAGGSKLQSHP